MISALMIGAQQCHPQVPAHLCPAVRPLAPPTCAQQITHLCPAIHPPVSSNAPTCA
ncbi:unnamed protein product, partial [Staurois parvus]